MAEGVGVAAQHRDLPGHALEQRALAEQVEAVGVAVGDHGLAQVALLGHRHGNAVAAHAAAPPPDESLGHGGTVDEPESRLAVLEQRDQGGEERNAAREADRPVDGIDQPAGCPGFDAVFPTVLFAEDRVVRAGLAQGRADHALRGPVGLGHRRAVALGLDGDVAEARQGLAARRIRRRLGRARCRLEVDSRHGGAGYHAALGPR